MSKIRTKYWIILSIWLLIFVGVFVSNLLFNYLNFQDVGILLAGISLGISLLALGLADLKKSKFNGLIEVWNKRVFKVKTANEAQTWYDITKIQITNHGNDPVQNFTVSIRVPQNIIENNHNANYFKRVRFGESSILIFETLKFLGVENADNFIRLEPAFSLDKWKKSNLYITISGDNISPTTFMVKLEQKEDLINSKPNKKLKLKVYG